MMIAANAMDLGSCLINQLKWLNEEPEIVDYLQTLGMKEDERVYGSVIIGYPASDSGLPNRNLMPQKGNEVPFIDCVKYLEVTPTMNLDKYREYGLLGEEKDEA